MRLETLFKKKTKTGQPQIFLKKLEDNGMKCLIHSRKNTMNHMRKSWKCGEKKWKNGMPNTVSKKKKSPKQQEEDPLQPKSLP